MPLWRGGPTPRPRAVELGAGHDRRRALDVRRGPRPALSASRARDGIGNDGFVGLAAVLLLIHAANVASLLPPSIEAVGWGGCDRLPGRGPCCVGRSATASRGAQTFFLAPQPFFEVRGTPLAVLHMTRALVALGHEVDLLTFPQGEARADERDPPPAQPASAGGPREGGPSFAKMALDVPFLIEAAFRLAFGRYDVVHAVEEAAHLVAPFARLLRVPLVMDVDSSIPDQLRYSGFAGRGPILWLARGPRDARPAPLRRGSHGVHEPHRGRQGPGAAGARVPGRRPSARRSGPSRRARTPCSSCAGSLALSSLPVVLYSGNFEPYQGVELLIDAAALVPGAQLLLMGGEPAEIARMRERTRVLGSLERCCFAGKRPPTELPAFLALATSSPPRASRARTRPSRSTPTWPRASRSWPTRIATHTQLLDDTTAFLVEPTPPAFASGLRQALEQPQEASARADRGYALVARDYSVARYREKIAAPTPWSSGSFPVVKV